MTADRHPPLVKASSVPLKRSPDDPGGRTVAELGGVGDLLRDQPAQTEEHLLPRPEQPLTPADGEGFGDGSSPGSDARAALEALVSEIQRGRSGEDGDVGAGGPSDDAPVNVPAPSRPTGTSAQPVTPRSVSSVPSAVPTRGTDVAALSQPFETAASGRYRVQLAAVREEADAKRAWDVFRQQLGPFITGLKPFFERAETSNGIFYRVQVGPFAETAEADRLCAELKKQNASCFVVSR
ncbi:MAG: SPOR domain-containing protein [Alphaproteobacteria bacterium]